MIAINSIKWLHLSDFHVGKDQYGQAQNFKSILTHVEKHISINNAPDFIFITGDVAQAGKQDQYETFINDFLLPLDEMVGNYFQDFQGIFMVPGNHDIDRSEAVMSHRYDALEVAPNFLDPTSEGKKQRETILPRFKAYEKSNFQGDWLSSEDGFFTFESNVRGKDVGILGINTAWLAGGEHDRNQLLIGKPIIETGLDRISKSDIKIVLGHHPISWIADDEANQVRAILGQYNAIYLHGHMHRSQSQQGSGAGSNFISVQAGSAFQAREDEKWINRFLWCSIPFDDAFIEVEPLQWSRNNQEWTLDGSALPSKYKKEGGDKWLLPLKPASNNNVDNFMFAKPQNQIKIPDGWILIDNSFLNASKSVLTQEDLLVFFDGRVPNWKYTTSDLIPKRSIVYELKHDLEASAKALSTSFYLLLGAGGEGKSTVIQQVIYELLRSEDEWNILWHEDLETPLEKSFLSGLPKSSGSWLIVSDEADAIVENIFQSVNFLHRQGRNYVHFLACCRDTDWLAAGGNKLPWREYINFVEKRLRGLSFEDALLIVESWGKCGQEGLGQLNDLSEEEAARRLSEAARSEENIESEGAFLGAMLRLRLGGTLKSRVKAFLYRLQNRKSPDGTTLLDAFAFIAIPHSYNILCLSKSLLAEVLNCKLSKIKQYYLGPLGDEAAAVSAGQFILTRHRAIAEATLEVLEESFYIDTDEILIQLVETACYTSRNKRVFIPELKKWRYLSSFFFNRGNEELGIRLAQAALKADQSKFFLVHLARLLRGAGQAELSLELFENFHSTTSDEGRAFCTEWAMAAAVEERYCTSIYLMAVAISDNTEFRKISPRKFPFYLLACMFYEVYVEYNLEIFAKACVAVLQILKKIQQEILTEGSLLGEDDILENEEKIKKNNLQKFMDKYNDDISMFLKVDNDENPEDFDSFDLRKMIIQDVEKNSISLKKIDYDKLLKFFEESTEPIPIVIEGFNVAWEYRERVFPDWISKPDELSFSQLYSLFSV